MSGVETITVSPAEGGLRLDRWFKQRYPALGFGPLNKLLRTGQVPARQLVITHRLSRHPDEFTVRTPAARVAQQLSNSGVTLHPGEQLHFLLVPGPEKAIAWEGVEGDPAYDRHAYTELMLRSIESVFAPLGVDRDTIDTWLLGEAGYWGPPGALPPPGMDIRTPLLGYQMNGRTIGLRSPTALGAWLCPEHAQAVPSEAVPVGE